MPRGVYDRSKMKKNTAEPAKAAPKAPKGKPGRKPGKKIETKAEPSLAPVAAATNVGTTYDNLFLLREVRENLNTLKGIHEAFGNSSDLVATEIVEHVKVLGRLSRVAFGTGPETETEEEEAPVAAAPVAAVVPAPVPAVVAPAAQFGNVPMPPSPIPTLATH